MTGPPQKHKNLTNITWWGSTALFFIEIFGVDSITIPLCEEMMCKGLFSAEYYYETRLGGEYRIVYRSDFRRAQALEWIKQEELRGGFFITTSQTQRPLSDFIEST